MTNEDPNKPEEVKSSWILSAKLYNSLKFTVMVFLPALSTLYFTLGSVWNFPAVEQVIGTTAAITTFLGLLLRHASTVYNTSDTRFDGAIKYTESTDGSKRFTLEVPGDPNEISKKDVITFKVAHE